MSDGCARCGLSRDEHDYNGAAYGTCGTYIAPLPRSADNEDDTLKLLAELERELGVRGATAVFRKALALAKAARAALSEEPPHA